MTDKEVELLARLSDLELKMVTGKADDSDLQESFAIALSLNRDWYKDHLQRIYDSGQALNRIDATLDRILAK